MKVFNEFKMQLFNSLVISTANNTPALFLFLHQFPTEYSVKFKVLLLHFKSL